MALRLLYSMATELYSAAVRVVSSDAGAAVTDATYTYDALNVCCGIRTISISPASCPTNELLLSH